ncbi:SMP-30/gluconolactonase/LRE family protein [Microbacterium timonense]|uniref:SMP-30/gluconolactonase/LRE family protein n=1 Tax=Microbacterium timonense TaxID=2086576 RepID=UPI001F3AE44F|nr:SMP-30/gluconolactonase/LRE family protein [Microbacterium timonense]
MIRMPEARADKEGGRMAAERLAAVYESFDERFADVGGDRCIECVFDGGRWLEGPAYHPAHRFVLFSDIPNERVLRFDERTGRVDVVDAASGFANGRTVDAQGRFVWCEHGGRRVARLEHDGSTSVVADAFNGAPLNSPNDVAVHSDGSVWFTDPTYGIMSDYEGVAASPEQPVRGVYRVDPDGSIALLLGELDQPNGIAFGPDSTTVYVTDSGTPAIWRAEVRSDGSTGAPERIADADVVYDGIRIDALGRLWVAAEDGVRCHDADGTLIGRIPLPETVANLEFGGPRRNILYITATTSLYVLRTTVRGLARAGG